MVTLAPSVIPAGPISCRSPIFVPRVNALETVRRPDSKPASLLPITKVPAVITSSSLSVRDNCPAVSVPKLIATPRVLLRTVTVPVEEIAAVLPMSMESAVRVMAAPEALVVMVSA